MLDLTKPIQTRDGRKVRIFATDASGEYCIVGEVDGCVYQWNKSGKVLSRYPSDCLDLVNVPEEREAWANIYDCATSSCVYTTKEAADRAANSSRIACVHVRYKVGEGL